MDARFFLENKEVIGLWIIFTYAMILAVAILDRIIDKVQAHRHNKNSKKRHIEQAKLEEQEKQKYLQKIKCSQQVKKVMNDDKF